MRRLSPDDAELWRRVARDIAPLPGRPINSPPPRTSEPSPASGEGQGGGSPPTDDRVGAVAGNRANAPARRSQSPAPPPLDQFARVDRATAERLRRGRRAIEARLDLHGMTQAEAHRALQGFVSGSRAAGRRCVLVITGHGRSSGGILKSAVPRWLHEPDLRRDVLAIAPARPQHGGSGALYLLLRKPS
jgi:DNA-nicking Smr family endonuclease